MIVPVSSPTPNTLSRTVNQHGGPGLPHGARQRTRKVKRGGPSPARRRSRSPTPTRGREIACRVSPAGIPKTKPWPSMPNTPALRTSSVSVRMRTAPPRASISYVRVDRSACPTPHVVPRTRSAARGQHRHSPIDIVAIDQPLIARTKSTECTQDTNCRPSPDRPLDVPPRRRCRTDCRGPSGLITTAEREEGSSCARHDDVSSGLLPRACDVDDAEGPRWRRAPGSLPPMIPEISSFAASVLMRMTTRRSSPGARPGGEVSAAMPARPQPGGLHPEWKISRTVGSVARC